MTTTTKCVRCGIDIARRRHYCDNCRIINHKKWVNDYRIAHKKRHYCIYCGKLLSGIGRIKYCLEHSNHKEPKGLCEYCHINQIKHHAKKYCSRECMKKSIIYQKRLNRKVKYCIKCKKDLTGTLKHKYCPECSIIAKKEQTKKYNQTVKFKHRKCKFCIICGNSLSGIKRHNFCYTCVPKEIEAPNIPGYVKRKFPEKFVYIPTASGTGREAIFADGMSAKIQKQVPKMIEETMKRILNEEETSKRCDKRDSEGWCTLFGNYPKSRILCKYWPEECPILNNKIINEHNKKCKPCPSCGKPIGLYGRTCMECSKQNSYGLSKMEWRK